MAPKTISGNKDLGKRIRSRRNELGLTIEEAASRASVGTKTWCRYESGGSIRKDKCRGICKALNWHDFLLDANEKDKKNLVAEYKDHKAWSHFLEDNYGIRAALSFAIGSDLLFDYIEQDLSDIASMPCDAHIGQLGTSFLKDELPAQFLKRYNYDFLYQMKCTLLQLRRRASRGIAMTAYSVMEELIIYLCNEEAEAFMELSDSTDKLKDDGSFDDSAEWVFDLFDDMDIITSLYSDCILDANHSYYFSHWNDQQFFME